MTDDERIEERVRLYAGALHKRVLERVMHRAKQGALDPGDENLDWIGPLWVEHIYARELESLLRDDARVG
jgi:hypothetical protein